MWSVDRIDERLRIEGRMNRSCTTPQDNLVGHAGLTGTRSDAMSLSRTTDSIARPNDRTAQIRFRPRNRWGRLKRKVPSGALSN
jgi:hypothetical protein